MTGIDRVQHHVEKCLMHLVCVELPLQIAFEGERRATVGIRR